MKAAEIMPATSVTAIADNNDDFRMNPNTKLKGRWVYTRGINHLGAGFLLDAFRAVVQDTNFTPDTDPYGEHDRGFVTVNDVSVWWKIDCFEAGTNFNFGAENPANPETTYRVLTIYLPEEH